MTPPPPELGGGQVRAYAFVDETARFTGRLNLYVDKKKLGAVPCLALAEDLKGSEIVLLHCKSSWEIIAFQPLAVASLADAKARVENYYQGISKLWVQHPSSRTEALTLAQEGQCSFCRRTIFDVQNIIEGSDGSRICDICVRECYGMLQAD